MTKGNFTDNPFLKTVEVAVHQYSWTAQNINELGAKIAEIFPGTISRPHERTVLRCQPNGLFPYSHVTYSDLHEFIDTLFESRSMNHKERQAVLNRLDAEFHNCVWMAISASADNTAVA